ncbi:MAG: sarcosine oxidase subunit delta [Gemmatimonadetes bacterium]|nr:sarcosine oxidase subunit delta [Gemmatimonadota bacterium]
MLQIRCPWCGPRDEPEFRYGGEAHLRFPGNEADPAAWARFLYYRDNPAGAYRERWVHTAGCRQWFHVIRDTTSHRILGSYRLDEPPERAR